MLDSDAEKALYEKIGAARKKYVQARDSAVREKAAGNAAEIGQQVDRGDRQAELRQVHMVFVVQVGW